MPRHSVIPRALALLLGATACDATGPSRDQRLYAVLFASSIFVDQASSAQSGCALSGTWRDRGWPATSASATATIHLTRQFTPAGGAAVLRDTTLASVTVTLTRTDSVHITLALGPPLSQTLPALLDSVQSPSLGTAWHCPSTLPLGTDSTLLAHGYAADSLPQGFVIVTQQTPVD